MINVNNLWSDMKTKLSMSAKINSVAFELWVEKCEPLFIKDNVLVFSTPSQAVKNTIKKTYAQEFKKALLSCNEVLQDVDFITDDEKETFMRSQKVDLISKDEKSVDNEIIFIPEYTFDTFVIGSSNQFAAAACKAVAENPGKAFNPLFIYGGVGLGKTHLLHAIGNYVKTKYPTLKVLYVNSENFTNELIDSIRNSRDNMLNRAFREKYRNLDVFILDDVQFLSGKASTQEALFHTFNDLHQQGKQVIFSSDRQPKDIAHLEERLLSRFNWGLMADIQAPDIETRIAILQQKAISLAFPITPDVLRYIAEQAVTNIRELEGLLKRVIFYCNLLGVSANSIDTVKDALKDMVNTDQKEAVTMDRIADVTCRYFHITKEDMTGKKKTKEIVEPRQICIYLITELMNVPLASIGSYFGGRDHTTIMHARDKISDDLHNNKRLEMQIGDIKGMIDKI